MNDSTDLLWSRMLREAETLSVAEPVLASYFHTAVLSHPSLESALAYTLAEILGNATVSKQAVRRVIDEALSADPVLGQKIRRDIEAYRERDPACRHAVTPLLYYKGFHALQVYRVAHYLWGQERRTMAYHMQNLGAEIFGVDIHPAARLGCGIMIDHATGVVIGETAVVEDDVSMLHSVSLGGTGTDSGDRHPKIRSGVLIAAGAKVLGNIEVGEGAKIGAGSLVLSPVAPHTTVVGVPARAVGVPREASPAREMDQRINSEGGVG
ncbi:MAG TPA: serine O-acetyltransferase [Porticoccaceae bacterium]|nr:serine O-acetyltransferase [Porticoccaceae bacterium]